MNKIGSKVLTAQISPCIYQCLGLKNTDWKSLHFLLKYLKAAHFFSRGLASVHKQRLMGDGCSQVFCLQQADKTPLCSQRDVFPPPWARGAVHPILRGSARGGQLSDQLLEVNYKTSWSSAAPVCLVHFSSLVCPTNHNSWFQSCPKGGWVAGNFNTLGRFSSLEHRTKQDNE